MPAVLFPRILHKGGIRSLDDEMVRHSVTSIIRDCLPLVEINEITDYSAHSFLHSLASWGGRCLPADVLMQLGDWKKFSSMERYSKKNPIGAFTQGGQST